VYIKWRVSFRQAPPQSSGRPSLDAS